MPSADARDSRLHRVRWQGEATFRLLSYYCSVRWNRRRLGDYVQRVLGHFAVPADPTEVRNPPTPGLPPRYSLVDLGPVEANRYRLLYGDQAELFSCDHPGDALERLFWHINSETFRTTGSFLLIHAGSVVTTSGEGLVLPGSSRSGKSTLVAGLVQAGMGYLSDEAAAIDPITRRLYPYPKALSFKKDRPDIFELLGLERNGSGPMRKQWHLRPEDIRSGSLGAPSEVRFVIAPRYERGAPAAVTPITPAAAAVELARSALNLSVYGSRALPLVADVASRARSYRLVAGDLHEAVRTVAHLIDTGASDGP